MERQGPTLALPMSVAVPAFAPLRYRSRAGRLALAASTIGSGLSLLDATVVNVALPTIGRDLHASLTGLQWTVNAYTLTLSAFLLLGGSLGDRLGRRRIFVVGVAWFAVASVLCGLAPNVGVLIAARALQGVGAALLVPVSLALIEATFAEDDRSAAIGAWSGLGGLAAAIGPLVGGTLIDAVSWRAVFLINLPFAAVAIWLALRFVPETRGSSAGSEIDWWGATLAPVALAGLVYGLSDGIEHGFGSAVALPTLVGGAVALVAFLIAEGRAASPLLPLRLFRSRTFSGANVLTFVVYGAFGGALFLVPIQLQQVLGYSPLSSGAALVPVTVVMLLLSPRVGRLMARTGARLPMTVGTVGIAVGLAWLSTIGRASSYATGVLPAVLVFALGLVTLVAPLTSTVLASVGLDFVGVAAAVNNDLARIGGLVAVAVLPGLAGIAGSDYQHPAVFSAGYSTALRIAAVICAAGAVVAFTTIADVRRR